MALEARIKTAWHTMPIVVRLDVIMSLAGSALDHHDQAKALALINEAQEIRDGTQRQPEDRIPLMARLATLRFRADEAEKARSEASTALAMFESEREKIANVRRAKTLRPIAEAYASMGDAATALGIYRRAIDAGVENPNSRPRADDLSATCCSMAVHKVEPDSELWTRIHQIREGLGDPW